MVQHIHGNLSPRGGSGCVTAIRKCYGFLKRYSLMDDRFIIVTRMAGYIQQHTSHLELLVPQILPLKAVYSFSNTNCSVMPQKLQPARNVRAGTTNASSLKKLIVACRLSSMLYSSTRVDKD